jgi:protein NrfD
MRELIVNRVQPEVDPVLHAWAWQIPIDLFFAAVVSGMMILSGAALLSARDGRRGLGTHAPLLGFLLVHICLVALFLDLSHKLYFWNLYLTIQPASPMSWGAWILTLVYLTLLATALADLPVHWPWLARRVPLVQRVSDQLGKPAWKNALAWTNVALGTALALYTGVLLATNVARPLWNTMVLPPLFLASGLAGAAAALALAARFVPDRPAPPTLVGGLIHALIVPVAGQSRSDGDAVAFTRLASVFLVAQAILLALFVLALATGSASQIAALEPVLAGRFAPLFWLAVIGAGVVVPLVALGAAPRSRFAAAGLVLLLAGGLALRWLIVDAGQASRVLPILGFGT